MKKIKFSRVGGLSPVKQKGYTLNPDERYFHTPPAKKGIYAFIYPHFEPFLLGGDWSKLNEKNKQEKFEYLKDSDGNKIKIYLEDYNWNNPDEVIHREFNPKLKKHLAKGKDFYEDELSNKIWTEDIRDKDGNWINGYAIKKKKLKVFTYEGELWHHLKNKAVKPHEIIDEVGDWIKTEYSVFVKAYERNKIDCLKDFRKTGFLKFDGQMITTRNIFNFVNSDHLEVFIERPR